MEKFLLVPAVGVFVHDSKTTFFFACVKRLADGQSGTPGPSRVHGARYGVGVAVGVLHHHHGLSGDVSALIAIGVEILHVAIFGNRIGVGKGTEVGADNLEVQRVIGMSQFVRERTTTQGAAEQANQEQH
jgi:hypothetical protein